MTAPTPPRPHAPTLKFIPLGGVGTFGMNCAVLQWGDVFILIDAGIKFPQGNFPGVDLFLPDFTYVLENADRLKAIILTHGHDDHIGALPFLLTQVDVPVYGTAFTLAMVRERLANGWGEDQLEDRDLRQILFGQPFEVEGALIEAVPVDHSIPDSASLIIRTPAGTVVHSGDFRLPEGDADPRLEPLREAGREGVDLLLCDSTNADRPGVTPPESEVAASLKDLFETTSGRIFVATFASHVQRMGAVVQAAAASGRKVVLEGRRMVRNFEIASKLGYLSLPAGVVTSHGALSKNETGRVVYLTTGTQGEPFSALSRIARGEHSQIKAGPGDTVIFSSRMIPGNELAVGQNIDNLFRAGAKVYYQAPPRVHISGHASAEEISAMIRMTSPRHLVPVHGDYRNLVACADVARNSDVGSDGIHILDPGQILELAPSGARTDESVPAGRMLVDGSMIGSLADPILRDRRRMAREGVVVVAVSLPARGEKMPEPVVHSRGVIVGPHGEELDMEAAGAARRVLKAWKKERTSLQDLEDNLRTAVRGIYRKAMGKKPTVLPVILEE
jgi:ribonuclease J